MSVVIERKIAVPPLAEGVVERPRVAVRARRLLARHGVLLVVAAAGAGKTVAVRQAFGDGDVAWLSLDRTDRAPERLIAYLAAATGGARVAGLPLAEQAGLLGERLSGVLVVDRVEQLGDARRAHELLAALVRYRGDGARIVLVGSAPPAPPIAEALGRGAHAVLGDRELAFTEAEAAQLRSGPRGQRRDRARQRDRERELLAAIGRNDFGAGADLATDGALDSSPRLTAMLAWCEFHLGRPREARELVDRCPAGAHASAAAYMLSMAEDRRPTATALPPLTGGPFDAMVLRVHYGHGYLGLLREPPSASRWASATSAPWRASALGALGRTGEAERLLREEVLPRSPVHALNGIDVLLDRGRADEAEEQLERAREAVRDSGSVFLEMYGAVLRSRIALQRGRDPRTVLDALDRVQARHPVVEYRWIAQQVEAQRGLALLRLGEHGDAAATLQAAVDIARAGDRILELPAAAAFLAEARWQLGDERGADRAADLALAAARRQGSNHLLLQALREFPAVATRRADADADRASEWRALARRLAEAHAAPSAPAAHSAAPELDDLGAATLRPRRPGLRKAVELLAYLAETPGRSAPRERVLDALFDGRTDRSAQAYLRQATYKLRDALPPSTALQLSARTIALRGPLDTASGRFEAALAEAARLRDRDRLDALTAALALAARGDYLHGVDSAWVRERRRALDQRADDARYDAAELAFHLGEIGQAERTLDTLLRRDPFRERAWRLRMRIADQLGDEDRLVDAYRRCRSALAEAGLTPAPATVRLATRRAPAGPGRAGPSRGGR